MTQSWNATQPQVSLTLDTYSPYMVPEFLTSPRSLRGEGREGIDTQGLSMSCLPVQTNKRSHAFKLTHWRAQGRYSLRCFTVPGRKERCSQSYKQRFGWSSHLEVSSICSQPQHLQFPGLLPSAQRRKWAWLITALPQRCLSPEPDLHAVGLEKCRRHGTSETVQASRT